MRLSTLSTGFVPVTVKARKAGVLYDPTADPVYLAFKPPGSAPSGNDAVPAQWETDTTGYEPRYEAKALVGPAGNVQLVAGDYRVWAKVTDNPEVIFEKTPLTLTVYDT